VPRRDDWEFVISAAASMILSDTDMDEGDVGGEGDVGDDDDDDSCCC
jgi:hypothetical protein